MPELTPDLSRMIAMRADMLNGASIWHERLGGHITGHLIFVSDAVKQSLESEKLGKFIFKKVTVV